MNDFIEKFVIDPLIIISVCVILLASMCVPLGILFGIAYLADTYSYFFVLLYIPFIGLMDLAMREF